MLFPYYTPESQRTVVYTDSTKDTGFRAGTDPITGPAMGTAPKTDHQLEFRAQTFRIVAPLATQGTPLEKYGSTNTRTVKNGKFFDVEDCSH
jgi:hypothetical protein